MQEDFIKVPPEFLIRPACHGDQEAIQSLIWEFTFTEALELDLRIVIYRLVVVVLLTYSFFLVGSLTIPVYGELVKVLVIAAILFNCIYTLQLSSAIIMGIGTTWQKYWVVEKDSQLVACALLNIYTNSSELAYLFVKPAWRKRKIASSLIMRLIEESPHPLYLACKPKMINFYTQLGFMEISWHNLSQPVKNIFNLFQPHPKLWGFPIVIMKHSTLR
ncbi:MAG: GNAT family N-acetyltransferase [Spirulinaceae cyanobacterium]